MSLFSPQTATDTPSPRQALLWSLGIVMGGLILDQALKAIALLWLDTAPKMLGPIGFQLMHNPGFLGGGTNLGQSGVARAHVLGLGFSFSLTACLISWDLRRVSRQLQMGLLFLSAGVLGNLTDRILRWEVVDFLRLELPLTSRAIILNGADLLQWVGVIFLLQGTIQWALRVSRGTERRRTIASGFSTGMRARRIALFGMILCLLMPQMVSALVISAEAPQLFLSWWVLAAAFDIPALYLAYHLAGRVSSLANGPIFAMIRRLNRVPVDGAESAASGPLFRAGEEVPELEEALERALGTTRSLRSAQSDQHPPDRDP